MMEVGGSRESRVMDGEEKKKKRDNQTLSALG